MEKLLFCLLLLLSLTTKLLAQLPSKEYEIWSRGETPIIDGVIENSYLYNTYGMQPIDRCVDISTTLCIEPKPCDCDKDAATFAALRDGQFLYFVVQVKDSDVSAFDGVEIFIALDNDRSTNCPEDWPPAYGGGTFQLISSAANSTSGSATTPQVGNESPSFPIAAYAKTITSDGYIVEMSFDLGKAAFLSDGFQANVGRIIGFDIANNQANTGDIQMRAQSMWSNDRTNRNWTESINFGTALLTCLDCLGVNELSSIIGSITLAPNPAENNVRLIIEAKQEDVVSISVINSLSQKVYTAEQSIGLDSNNHEINTSELNSGIYTVVISNGNLNTTRKLVIDK